MLAHDSGKETLYLVSFTNALIFKKVFMKNRDFPPIHPGEILAEEFLKPMGISQYRLALCLHVPARRINEIVLEKRGITADTALRLSRFFGNSAEFWMNLQARYELVPCNIHKFG